MSEKFRLYLKSQSDLAALRREVRTALYKAGREIPESLQMKQRY